MTDPRDAWPRGLVELLEKEGCKSIGELVKKFSKMLEMVQQEPGLKSKSD